MGGLQLTRSRTLKDLSSYLSGWLSSLPFSRCRSRGAGGQVSPRLVLWGQASTPQPPFTYTGQPCPESGSKKVDGHFWLPLSSPQSLGAGQLNPCNSAPIPEHLRRVRASTGHSRWMGPALPSCPPRTHTFHPRTCFPKTAV